MLFYDFGLPLSAAARAAVPAAGCLTVNSGVGALTSDFATWLRAAHAETSGSAREAYERVAVRLGIALDGHSAIAVPNR